jgi:transposase
MLEERNYKLSKLAERIAPGPVYLGIDAHKKSLHATVVDSSGSVVLRRTVSNEWAHVEGLVRELDGHEVFAVYEAGPTGYQLLWWLRDLKCTALLTPPSLVPTRLGDRVKTDRKDSLRLAEWLRAGALRSVYELTKEELFNRELIRTYHQIQRHRKDLVRQIKSKIQVFGIAAPWEDPDGPQVQGLRKSDVEWLLDSPTSSDSLNSALITLTTLYVSTKVELQRCKKELERLSQSEQYAERADLLLSIDGIGLITAMTWLLEVPRVSKFATVEAFANWLGVVPSERSTGDAGDESNKRRGAITHAGNSFLRAALVQVAWGMFSKDPSLRALWTRVRQRSSSQTAIVAVAHKLARRLYAVMRDMVQYRVPAPPELTATATATAPATATA